MQAQRPLVRFIAKQVRRYHDANPNHKFPHMNELPVPCGSWQEAYNAKNRYYNSVLVAGVAFSVFSLIATKASGLIFLNFSPPKSID